MVMIVSWSGQFLPSQLGFHLNPLPSSRLLFGAGISFHGQNAARLFCNASFMSADEKKLLLAGVDDNDLEVVGRIVEQAKQAVDRWELIHSDFLTPPVIDVALNTLKRMSNVGVVVSGGYPEAERCRLSLGHRELLLNDNDKQDGSGYPDAVAALSISGNFFFESATHGDFLGAILGTGISRAKVGDILLQGIDGAQILVVPELVDHLQLSLKQVRNIPVTCTTISLTSLHVKPPRVKVIKSVEASLRVDALVSVAFNMSRSKLAELIRGGDVRVNWREVTKNNRLLKIGDVISVRGKGRAQLVEVKPTKKQRYAVELVRLL